jgi:manganese-dependent inorganic pyrophosphatase
MNQNDSTLVIGHRNPDTDAIASAVGYAWLLNEVHKGGYVAGRAGEPNAQATYALKRFGLDAPTLVVDVWGRVGDLAEVIPSLNKSKTLLEACQGVAKTRRPAPILDESGKPLGLLSGAELFAILAEALGSASVLALAKELDRQVGTAVPSAGTVFNADDHIRDIIGQALRSDQDDFLVVDEKGDYFGLCRKSALLAPTPRKIIMVDHNEPGQAVPGIEDAEVTEVVDHHRLGNLPTVTPIRFHVEPVGSCSTLVAERGIESNIKFAPSVAGMLLCGILSDTLVFRSPTTTPREKAAALKLAMFAGLCSEGASKEELMTAINALGDELLAAGAGFGSRTAEELVNSDLKFYETSGFNVGIAQVEVANFQELDPRVNELQDALDDMVKGKNLAMSLLMVTDVVRGNSRLVVAGQQRIIAALPYARLDNHTLDAPGVVSRKKQLLPAVLGALSQVV